MGFTQFSLLASTLLCLPISNATVERLFSIMSVIKNKLCNHLAVPIVEAILTTQLGFKRRGESCANLKVLPGMMENFNSNMYDHVRAAAVPVRAMNGRQMNMRRRRERRQKTWLKF